MDTPALWMAAVAVWLAAGAAPAHEVQPSVADVEVGEDIVSMTLRTAVEPLVAGIDLSVYDDTDAAPQADENDALRALPPDALEDRLRAAWPAIADAIAVEVGDATARPALAAVAIPPVGDPEIRRDSTLTLTAPLPEGDAPVTIRWGAELGSLVVRAGDAEAGYEAFLTDGAATAPLPRPDRALGARLRRALGSIFE